MSRPRVVHVVEALGLGGLERVVRSLARHARGTGFDVEVLCAVRGGIVGDEMERDGTPVRVLGVDGYHPADILATARALRAAAPDVVHSHGHFAGVLGRAAAWWTGGSVAVHHLHTLDTTLRARHVRLERLLGRVTRRVICCSQAVAGHAAHLLKLPPAKVVVVPNGIEPSNHLDRAAARAHLGNPPPPIVGCLGSLTAHKGQRVLIEALSLLAPGVPPPTVVLVGDGPERAALEARAAGRVRFAGERPDARDLVAAFDVLVVPSLAREGFGLAALEAMDAGVPVIASRVGGLPEVVADGVTGVLVPPGDAPALAGALTDLLGSPDRRRTLGEAGRRRVEERFRADAMARAVERLYEEALHVRRAA